MFVDFDIEPGELSENVISLSEIKHVRPYFANKKFIVGTKVIVDKAYVASLSWILSTSEGPLNITKSGSWMQSQVWCQNKWNKSLSATSLLLLLIHSRVKVNSWYI